MLNVKAILLLAGRGLRFNSALPKQFHAIGGKKIYLHTLEKLVASGLFGEIILVCSPEWIDEVQKEVRDFPAHVVLGGKTRQDSSYLGLLACGEETDYVLIHDAVRPFVSQRILEENIAACQKYGAANTCIPSADTLVHTQDGKTIDAIPPRAFYMRGQTPQSFSYPLILEAHKKAEASGFTATDDCALVLAQGLPVHLLLGEDSNIKITTDLDLYLAEQLFRRAKTVLPKTSLRPLAGKRYAITGGTGDIGRAIADHLEQEGAHPLLLSRSSPLYPIDLREPMPTKKLFEKIFQEHGPLDGLINSIGLLKLKEVEQLLPTEIEELIDTNLTSVIFACRYAQIKPGGDIVNIASSSYSRGRGGFALYSAAKAAVVNFTQALAEERPELKINVLVPQRTNTRMRSGSFPHEDPSSLLSPKQVAEAALSLLQEQLGTGLVIEVRKEALISHNMPDKSPNL